MPRVQDLVQLNFSPNQAKHLCDSNGGWYQPFLVSNGLYTDDAWVYASATTVTVPTDATARYQIGDKVRLKQGGGYKYFYVGAVTSTVLTLVGGDTYTVANSTITDLEVSRAERPFGFPIEIVWTPTHAATGSMTFTNLTVNEFTFWIIGGIFYYRGHARGDKGGTASTALTFTLPTGITQSTPANAGEALGWGLCYDNAYVAGSFVKRNTDTTCGVFRFDEGNWAVGGSLGVYRVLGNLTLV